MRSSTRGGLYAGTVFKSNGGTVIAEDNNSTVIAVNTFETITVTYTPGDLTAQQEADLAGLPIQIRLCALEGADRSTTSIVAFDSVTLAGPEQFSGTDYATWAGGFTLTDATFNGDDDGDGLDNGIEGFFGTNPSLSSTGLAEISKSGNEVTFTHPNPDGAEILTDVTGSYEWSLDMVTWYLDDGVEGPGGPPATTTVTTVATADSPAANTTTVVATIGGTVPEKLFLRVVATQP